MKKALALVIVSAFILSFAMPVLANDLPRPVDKIVKGAVEVLKSPGALIDSPKSEMDKSDNKVVGFVKGVLLSPFHLIDRAGHGILKIVTFPIDE